MRAKEYLLQVKKLDRIIANKLIEKEQWKVIALGTTAPTDGERVQCSSSQQKMADAVSKYIDIEKEIDACIDRLIERKQEIISTIEQLPEQEYDVLHMKYIQFKTLDDVMAKHNWSERWTTTVHGRALSMVQKIIDERNKVKWNGKVD